MPIAVRRNRFGMVDRPESRMQAGSRPGAVPYSASVDWRKCFIARLPVVDASLVVIGNGVGPRLEPPCDRRLRHAVDEPHALTEIPDVRNAEAH